MAKDMRMVPPGMPSVGGATEEQTSPASMRAPSKGIVTHDGPQIGENREYLPATYEVTHTDPKGNLHTLIREDR